MINVDHVTKHYGATVAVDNLSFEVRPGQVTGFLGPNGAGKSTTMRMIVGLDQPTAGQVTIDGQCYRDLRFRLRQVGALLEAKAVHPARNARNHLRWLADSNDIDHRRVDEVLDLVGLTDVANRRTGGFSLGMGQRLGVATALLGDPATLLVIALVGAFLPASWNEAVAKYFPAQAGTAVFSVVHDPRALAPWTGYAVLIAWTTIAMVAGAVILLRRDV